jgi:hypothetical protein
VRSPVIDRAGTRLERESGQAITEFALVLFPLLLLVAGILHFGIGLNYWLDMQRLANQGARWAAVDRWPTCPPAQSSCTGSNTLQEYVKQQAVTQGLRSSSTVTVCFPNDNDASTIDGSVGTPVRVRIESPFSLVRLFPAFSLSATATMRIENVYDPRKLTGVVSC